LKVPARTPATRRVGELAVVATLAAMLACASAKPQRQGVGEVHDGRFVAEGWSVAVPRTADGEMWADWRQDGEACVAFGWLELPLWKACVKRDLPPGADGVARARLERLASRLEVLFETRPRLLEQTETREQGVECATRVWRIAARGATYSADKKDAALLCVARAERRGDSLAVLSVLLEDPEALARPDGERSPVLQERWSEWLDFSSSVRFDAP
jgi:hypothetical protein